MKKLLLTILPILFTQPVFAHVCDNYTTQSQMTECATNEYKKADRELNQVYQQVMANLSPKQKITLRNEQRAWIRQKERTCQATGGGGSMRGMAVAMCLEEQTNKRILELKALANPMDTAKRKNYCIRQGGQMISQRNPQNKVTNTCRLPNGVVVDSWVTALK